MKLNSLRGFNTNIAYFARLLQLIFFYLVYFTENFITFPIFLQQNGMERNSNEILFLLQ